MKAFNFTIEDINFMIAIKKSGLISGADGERMLDIYRNRINPEYQDFCLSCGETLRLEFKRLESLILQHYNKQALGAVLTLLEGQAKKKAAQVVETIENEQTEQLEDLNKLTKKEIIQEVKNRTGEEIKPNTKREALKLARELLI